jgi:RNA polymerase sigma factor for flagellar operon FliA
MRESTQLPGGATPPGAGIEPADPPEVHERIGEGMPLVGIIAQQLGRELGGHIQRDDLMSCGREGLLRAARSFDPTYGVPFRRWANLRIRGAMIDGVRAGASLPRSVYAKLRMAEAARQLGDALAEDSSGRPPATPGAADARLSDHLASVATAAAVALVTVSAEEGEVDGRDPSPGVDELLARSQVLAAIREAMKALPDAERHLVQRHYFDDVRLDEAAAEIGLSKSWGSRLHARAIEALTRQMKRERVAL